MAILLFISQLLLRACKVLVETSEELPQVPGAKLNLLTLLFGVSCLPSTHLLESGWSLGDGNCSLLLVGYRTRFAAAVPEFWGCPWVVVIPCTL